MMGRSGVVLLLVVMLALLRACGGSGPAADGEKGEAAGKTAEAEAKAPEPEPVTVSLLLDSGGSFTNDDLQKLFIDPVQKKYPYITLKLVQNTQNFTPENWVATNSLADVLYIDVGDISTYQGMQAIIDLTPLIKKHNYDLGRLEPDMLEALKRYGSPGQLYALPFIGSGAALYFNKDLLNKFNVPFPRDGMTWDEVIELADQMGRKSDDPRYKFLDPGTVTKFSSSLAPGYIDPTTGKAALMTDKWKRIFGLYQQIRTLPNNEGISKAKTMFTKDRTLAMYAYVNNVAQYVPLIKDGLNWDMVSYPSFKEAPGKGLEFSSHDFAISATSKVQDAAFQVISALTGDEAQLQMSERAMIPAAKDTKIKEAFATIFPELKQNHINAQALFKVSPVVLPPVTTAVAAVQDQVEAAMDSVLAGQDINTALRTAEETAIQAIAALDVK